MPEPEHPEPMVVCRICKIEKPLSKMARDRSLATGYRTKCAACKQVVSAAYKASHRQQVREYERARDRARIGTEKEQARRALREAVRSGRVVKPSSCQDCGRSDLLIHGHHDDYTKPFEVVWVCRWCHVERHRPPTITKAWRVDRRTTVERSGPLICRACHKEKKAEELKRDASKPGGVALICRRCNADQKRRAGVKDRASA
jgi:superfamily II helicase